jgi:CBS domain-containing membrane protein
LFRSIALNWFSSFIPAPIAVKYVCTVNAASPITELVPMFANYGHRPISVLDAAGRVVGMITQLDLISGLYRQTFTKDAQPA